jgi:hypothetical protein
MLHSEMLNCCELLYYRAFWISVEPWTPLWQGFDFSKTGEARKGYIFVALASPFFVWF